MTDFQTYYMPNVSVVRFRANIGF